MFYVKQHYLSNALELADALIAATSVSTGIPLVTGNYKVVKELDLIRFKP